MEQNNQEKILEATKDKQTGHDESVLNPVYKNESDLSRKEKRLLEKEKLKGMLASWTAGFEKKPLTGRGHFIRL